MRFSQFFETGPTRIPIDSSYYLGSIVALLYSQTLLAAVKPKYMSTSTKRVIATPFVLADIIFPMMYRDASETWNLLGATIPFMAFLRYFDLFWVAPVVQGKDAYASMKSLQIEFWSCLREFSKEEKKEFVKDRKFYHILPNLLFHAIIADVIGAWFMTFTQEELMNMYFTRPFFFVGFFLVTLIAMNSGFTANGYFLQLIYVILYEKGSYCEKQWRRLMENPICATSLGDIWSLRWHQSLKPTWLNLPFKEVRYTVERKLSKCGVENARRLATMVAALSVFMCSGLLHEYLAYVNIGYTEYKLFAGQEMCFFTIQGIAVMMEILVSRSFKHQSWAKSPLMTTISRIWALSFLCITSPLFLRAFMHWDAWHAGAFFPYQAQILQAMHKIPGMHYFCGSSF
ncbi:unnamed protein product [Mucor hiemalis]